MKVSINEATIRTPRYNTESGVIHRSEYRKETILVLKQGETLNFSTLNLKAKYPLSGFITGKPLPKDRIVMNDTEEFTVGAVEPNSNGLSEVELTRQSEPHSNWSKIFTPGVVA